MDWRTRKVLSWRLSNTMEADFCVQALETAIQDYGYPEIFNTDQGAQFTSEGFTGMLKKIISRSAWMAKVVTAIIFSLSGYGEQ